MKLDLSDLAGDFPAERALPQSHHQARARSETSFSKFQLAVAQEEVLRKAETLAPLPMLLPIPVSDRSGYRG